MIDEITKGQPTARFIIHHREPRTTEEQEAKNAFSVFCRTSAIDAESGEPGAAPSGGLEAPSLGSAVPEGRHR
jgi:hypothetical protein